MDKGQVICKLKELFSLIPRNNDVHVHLSQFSTKEETMGLLPGESANFEKQGSNRSLMSNILVSKVPKFFL